MEAGSCPAEFRIARDAFALALDTKFRGLPSQHLKRISSGAGKIQGGVMNFQFLAAGGMGDGRRPGRNELVGFLFAAVTSNRIQIQITDGG